MHLPNVVCDGLRRGSVHESELRVEFGRVEAEQVARSHRDGCVLGRVQALAFARGQVEVEEGRLINKREGEGEGGEE